MAASSSRSGKVGRGVGIRGNGFLARLTAIVCALGLAWQAQAATDGYPAPPLLLRTISLAEGLPSTEVFGLAEDTGGDLWMATNAGLVRYDGHGFEVWRPPGMPRGAIDAVLLDERDRLWLGLVEGGLIALESDRRSFSHWHQQDPPGWPTNDIWSLQLGPDGQILIGSFEQGLIELDPVSGQWRQDPLGDAVSVLAMLQQDDGTLWLATRNDGLYRRLAGAPAEPISLPEIAGEQLRALAWHQQALWIAAGDRGLCRLPAASVQSAESSPELVCEEWPSLSGLSRRVHALIARPGGELWAARRDGLSWRDSDGQWTHLAPRPGALGSLPARILWNLQFDSHGGLWVATLGGGFAYLSALAWTAQAWVPAPGEPGALPESRVRGLAPEGNLLWIGTQEAGLRRLDRRSGVITAVPVERTGGAQRVWDLARRPEGLWVARDGGVSLLRMDGPDLQWPLTMDGGPIDGLPDDLLDPGDGTMLVSILGRGVYRLAPGSSYELLAADEYPPRNIEQLFAGPDAPWVASERGLHRFDRDCNCLRWWPQWQQRVHALAIDGDGRWWLALEDSLQWREAGSEPGRLLREVAWTEAPAGGIAADRYGRVWIAGPAGLAVLEPGAERVRHLAGSLGPIAAELSDKPFSIDAKGRLWFGSDRGVLRIDPALLPAAPVPRRLGWEEISIRRDGQRVELDPSHHARLLATDSDLQVAARVAMPLEAGALHYRSRIDGWDPDWVDMAQGRRAIGVLPAGHYQLQVQVWHPATPDSLLSQHWRFEVAPPWWRQWPFLLLWLSLAVIALWLTHRWQKRRIEAAHQLQLHRQQAQWAEQSAAETNAFLARLSHEIRNPLSGLLGLLRQAEADSPRPQQRERLGLVRSAALQISALVDDVLVWARGAHGQLVTRCEPVLVGPLVAEALARQQPQADARKLTLVSSGDPALAVRVDRSRLLQILDNLLGNALKFTERGRIELGWRALGSDRVQLWIQDDGPGIPASDREAVFQAHRQLDADGRGLGLGLAIARDLAQAMGGRLILIDPPLGLSGARFALELPRAAAPAPSPISTKAPANDLEPTPSSRRWLLVEDDPLQRASLTHELVEGGFQVEAVAEALSALTLLRSDPALGLITDLGLPEVDGLTLIRMTRALTSAEIQRRPIIVLTARVLPADRDAAFEAGADVVLHKPIEPTELYAQLRMVEKGGREAEKET